MLHNDLRDIQIRRCSSVLFNIGTGILAFSAWNVVKTLYYLPTNFRQSRTALVESLQEVDSPLVRIISVLLLIVTLLLTEMLALLPPLYVGRKARAMARGEAVGRKYIFLAGLMILGSLLVIAGNVFSLFMSLSSIMGRTLPEGFKPPEKIYRYLTTIFIEVTSVIVMSELIVNDLRIRRLKRSAEKESADRERFPEPDKEI